MKNIAVLGSTGSVGTQTLKVVRNHRESFNIVALTCGHNISLLKEQIEEFHPLYVAVAEEGDCLELSKLYPGISFGFGIEGISCAACESGGDIVVNSLLGMLGIRPTLDAINAGKDIAFANKETLVAGGSLIMDAVKRTGVRFLPVDSEHSAIFQCLQAAAGNPVSRLILTASGGPFRGYTKDMLAGVTKAQALKHPNWSMGAKITVDSATMMNKGLEVIEASWLFGMPAEKIQVVVHPQSAVHSAVEFEDGSIIAQLGVADMAIPIAYALSYPKRLENVCRGLNLFELGTMTFEKPDPKVFRCLGLAFEAIKAGGSYPLVLNASNEEAVAAFLNDRVSFTGIAELVETALNHHTDTRITSVDDILELEASVRAGVRAQIGGM